MREFIKVRVTKNVNPYWKRDGFETRIHYLANRKKLVFKQALALADPTHPSWLDVLEARQMNLI